MEKQNVGSKKIGAIVNLVLKGVALAMGIAIAVLSIMNKIDINSAIGMLGIGLACLSVTQFSKKEE